MTTSAKSPRLNLGQLQAELAGIRMELARLSTLLGPTSIPALKALADLQKSICETARKHIDPQQHALDEIVERMSEDIGASLARDIVSAIEVRLEPYLPLLLAMLGELKAAKGDPGGAASG